jgi:putative ABC transport system permease protein
VMMVVRQGMLLAIGGAVLGVVGALALTRLLTSLLYATSPTDTVTFALVSMLFFVVAIVASLIPARQVTSIDPLSALRQE